MLGKKEKKLNLNEIERVKQRFSIRKYSFGVTSVLLGLSFIFGPASPVKADTTTDTQTAAVTAKANKDTGQSEATTAETATSAAASTATSEATSSTTSTASAETSAASSEASSQASTEKTSTDSTAASEASKTTDTSEEKKTTESTASTASSETSEDTNNVNSNAIVSAAAVASAPATNTESNASAAASDNTSDGASTADSTASCEAKQTSDASTADSSVNTEATTEVKATPALAVANTSATDNNTKVDQTVIQGESLVMSTDKIGNLGNEDNQIVVTVAVTGNAGDVFTLKIPTNTTSKTKSVLYGVNDVTPLPNADTTTTLDSENGYYIITDTLTSSSSINQKITLTPYRNDGFDGTTTDYIIESESIGNREFTMTLTGQDESGNDLGTATATFTQVMNPQMTPSLNRYPATEDMSEILPNTDYTYQLSLKETTGIISDAQWPIQRVIKSINYGTTITIPVPSSFKLNVDATMAKNAFTDQTTITQAGIGKNIVISVPKGSGESQSNGNAPYYLIGQYVVDGTVKETVSADSPITIDQNLNDEQSKKLIGNAQITWVDKINSEAQLGTAKLSIRGAWEGFTLGLHDVANRLSNFYVENASTYDITDAAFTFDMADGFNATGIKTSAIKGTTSYNYELTYADGTTSTGTVAAGDTINANGSSPIRKAVLRPDVFAAKARTGNQYYMTYAMRSNPDDLFYILGTLAEKYDNGTAVKVGDKLTNSMTVTSSMLKTATIAYPQTIVPDQPTGFIASGSYIGRAGETNKYEIVNGSNAEWGTYIIKKPVIYLKLPQYAIFNRAASTIDGDPEITVFAVDNGDAQVIKLDYSKTDYVFDTSKQIFRISVDISDDAIPGLYQGLSFITTDSQMTLIKLAKDDKLYKAEYTEGIVSDKTYISNTTSLRVMQSSEEFTIGATSKGNQDGIFKNKGVSDTTGTDDMTFKLTPKNTTNHSLTNVRIYTNIPSEANVVLTGPVSTDKANVWYATSAVDLTSNTEETGLTWLTADQVTDWSTIKSIKFGMDTFDKTTQANKTSFEIPVKDLSLQGDVGKTLTLGYKTYSDDFVTPIKKAVATSIVITGPVSESKEIKRTINVHLPSGETQTTTQVVTVTRTGQMDETGAVTYGDWTTGSWDEFTAPTVKGYTPSQSSVEAATVDSTMSDVTVDITYTGDAQKARVDYLDEDNSNAVIQSSDELTGLTNEAIPYSTADVIKALQEKGYVLVTDNFPSGATFDDDVAVDQIFTVIFKHGQEDTTRTQNVTQNVTYVVPDGFDKPADSAQTLTFTQTGKKDLVNGTVTWDAVDDQSFVEVVSPTIAGLTPDKTVVDASDVTPDFTGDKTSTVTVTYTADAQKATVVYVDQDNNNVEVANSGELTGVSKGTIVYSTADTIKALEEKGYVLVTDGFPTDSTFDTDSALDQVFTVVLKHGHEATTRTQNVTQNVTYVVPDGFDQPADSTQTLSFTQTGTKDLVTGNIVWDNVDNQSFNAVTSPTIAGLTPDKTVVDASDVTPDFTGDKTSTVTVAYTADAQKATVVYVDQDNNNAEVANSGDLTGTSKSTINYSTVDTIKALEEKGYVLVTDGFPTDATFDTDKNIDQVFMVVLKHGQEASTRTQNVTQTVTYVVPDGFDQPTDSTQTLSFTQTGKKDLVTGTVTWNAVDDQSFAEVVLPTIAGLTPDTTEVAASDVTPDFMGDKTSIVTVTYTADAQKAKVVFIDQDNNNAEVANSGDLTGTSKSTINYSTANTIKALEEKGYVLVTDGFPTDAVFDTDSTVDQVFTVVLKHGQEATTRTQNVTQTVTYVVPDGFDKPADSTQTLSFTQTGTKDLVTGNIVWDNVDSQSFTAVQVPVVAGLTPDQTEVASSEVTPDFTGDKTNTETVTYTADKQTARIIFVDQDNGDAEIANSGELSGVSKGTINYSTANTIKVLEEKGYVLVTDGFPTDAAFDTDSTVDQVFTVVLKHGQEATTRTQNVTQTVTYVVPDGFDQPADSTQTLSFTQTGTKDLVTGNIVWDNVDSQSFTAVQVPTVEGLTPDKTEVASSEVTPDFNGDKTNTVTVTYTADKQTARVVFVDKDNNGVEVANSGDLTGVSKGTIAYSTADTIKALEEKGYVLVTDGFPSNASFDTDSSVDQVFTVVLKHGQEAASRTQNVTQTVTYVVPEGFDKPADSTQTLSFTQTGTKDLVTGNITWDNVDSENFTTVQVPAVEGLTPDKTEVASSEVTPDFNGDKTNTVTVTYTADKQTARVVFVDEDNNGAEVANSGDLTGTSKSTIVYSTADTIKSLEEKGYVLVNDGFTAGTTFDMDAKTDQVCTVTLKHGIKETVATKDATQIIHYQGLDEAVPDQTQVVKDAFKQTTYVDQVTGETVKTDPWTGTAAFTAVQTPVVNGYHADQAQAGGITASPDQPTVETTVTYAKNGSLILVDQNGQQLAGTTQTQYTTDPADPTKVLAVTVPSVDGYEPQGKTVGETITPADPSANTYVVYTQKSTVPSEPVTPSEPEQPTTPTEPETPTTPEQPTTPSEPTQPTTPTTPSTPEVPSKPATPSEPTQPATPVQPTTPATPSTPEVPSKPATPSVPKATAKTVTGQKNKTKLTANQTKLPQTGESEEKSVLLSLMGAALTIGAGLLGAFTKRKKH